jgi:hypothetical protein
MLDDLTTILHTKNYKKHAVSSRSVKLFITGTIR